MRSTAALAASQVAAPNCLLAVKLQADLCCTL